MEHFSNPLKLVLGENDASKKQCKQKISSRKRHHISAKHRLHSHSNEINLQDQAKENTYSADDSFQYVPLEELVLRKLKRERKLLKKWTLELNQAKGELCNSNADEFSSTEPNISEIQKRYRILLPAIKLAMGNMDQEILSKSYMNETSGIKDQPQGNDLYNKIQEPLDKDIITNRGLAEEGKRRKCLREIKELVSAKGTSEKNLNHPDSKNSLMTEFSKQQLVKRTREKPEKEANNFISENPPSNPDSGNALMRNISKERLARQLREQYVERKEQDNIKSFGDEIKDPLSTVLSSHPHCQSLKQISTRCVKDLSIQYVKPSADGEIMGKENVCTRRTVHLTDHTKKNALGCVRERKLFKKNRLEPDRLDIRDNPKKTPIKSVVPINDKKYHSRRHFQEVEQNVLCTAPNNSSQSFYSNQNLSKTPSTEPLSETSFTAISNAAKSDSSDKQTKCKCKDKKNSEPCICKCNCEDEIGDSKISPVSVLSGDVPSSNVDEGRPIRRRVSLEPKNRESIKVQTSFPSSIGPCKPDTCPKRQKRFVENRHMEVQTDDTDIEWQYEPPVTQFKRNVVSAFKIPPKRTATMDDRLLRRVMYFDSHQSSVCNKNVEFCTYNVHQTKKGFPKDAEKVLCSDCPGSRKCNIVLSQHPHHLTCNEIVVEVNSLELNQEGVDSLMKVCSFLYIDYVFLGHVGNETNLAPVSSNIFFDSRKTYSVSMRFNKKERSILREQSNPSGLLVKDSVMFIVVCQAAPEFDIYKNWDFGFGYLSMKQVGEQMGSEDKISMKVELQKIGGTKNNIGRLVVTIEGLKTIRIIMNEELRCIEPHVDTVMKKLKLNRKEVAAMENNQTTCVRKKPTCKR